MRSRLLSRLIGFMGLGTVGLGVTALVAVLGFTGYLILNWENPSFSAKGDSRPRTTQVSPRVKQSVPPIQTSGGDSEAAGILPEELPAAQDPTGPTVGAPLDSGLDLSLPVLLVSSAESSRPAFPVESGRAGDDSVDADSGGASEARSETPAIPHTTSGRDQCTACHVPGGPGAGIPGGTGLPPSHAGRTDTMCQSCHTPASSDLPGPETKPATIDAPAIRHPVSGMEGCTSCHTVGGAAPTGLPASHENRGDSVCQACHTSVQIPPISTALTGIQTPAILHVTQGMETCTVCHTAGGPGVGAPGGTGLPADHQGRSDSICQACHTQVLVSPAPIPGTIITANAILHPTQGMEGCTNCHAVGGSGAGAPGGTGMPSDHQGRTNAICQTCHDRVDVPLAPVSTSTSGPVILHSTQGMESCTSCHAVGGPGVDETGGTGMPSDHRDRGDSICRTCHTKVQVPPTSTPPAAANVPAIRHSTEGRDACTTCHQIGGPGVGAAGGTGLPDSHQGRTDATCQSCHTRVEIPPTTTPSATPTASLTPVPTGTPGTGTTPPLIPHSLEGRQSCTNCHAVGGSGAGAPGGTGLPSSHQGRTDSTCLLCHTTAQGAPTSSPTASPTMPTAQPPSVSATPAPTATPRASATPVPSPTPGASPPLIPHSTQNRQTCTRCHTVGGPGVGTAGGTGLPSDHQGRTDSSCLACHTRTAISSDSAIVAAATTATRRRDD